MQLQTRLSYAMHDNQTNRQHAFSPCFSLMLAYFRKWYILRYHYCFLACFMPFVAMAQSIRAFVPLVEGWMFESQP